MSFAAAEADRRLADAVRVGTVSRIVGERAVVDFGGAESAELDVATISAGGHHVWMQRSVGEQVVVVCPSGDLSQGIVLASLRSGANAAPSGDPGAYKAVFADGTVVEHAGGVTTIECATEVTVKAPLVRVPDGDVVAGSISLRHHTHSHGDPAGETAPPS